jgi:aminopeptidase N
MLEIFSNGEPVDLSTTLNVVKNTENNFIFNLTKKTQTIQLSGMQQKPVPSILRQFSAPVNLKFDPSKEDLNFLIKKDTDPFVRWECAQKIYSHEMHKIYEAYRLLKTPLVSPLIFELLESLLQDPTLDPAMKALLLEMPDDAFFVQSLSSFNSSDLNKMRSFLDLEISKQLKDSLLRTYLSLHSKADVEISQQAFGKRKLKNQCLYYLSKLPETQELSWNQLKESHLMNDQQAAFSFLVDGDVFRDQAIDFFFSRWKHESLVLNKWFATLASSSHRETFSSVQKMTEHPDFQLKNPNRVYSLLARFGDNLAAFHSSESGSYEFFCKLLKKVDELNPNVASRLAQVFDVMPKLDRNLQKELRANLQQLLSSGLSSNAYEVISNQVGSKDANIFSQS